MKFFVAFAALVAVAIASPLFKPTTSDAEQLEAIIAAIQSPSTDPVTAALLEDMLADLLGVGHPVAGPAIVEEPIFENPVAGPALIDFPHHEVPAEAPVEGSPVVVGPIAESATPLVQIIVNAASATPGVGAGAGAAPAPALLPADAVVVADSAPEVVDDVQAVDGVQVVDTPLEPIAIGTPELPSPVAIIPDDLN